MMQVLSDFFSVQVQTISFPFSVRFCAFFPESVDSPKIPEHFFRSLQHFIHISLIFYNANVESTLFFFGYFLNLKNSYCIFKFFMT